MKYKFLYLTLMLLFGAIFAINTFNVEQYFFANETNVSINKQNFTLDNDTYFIINISEKPTFLVKDEKLVQTKSEIEAILKNYYNNKYTAAENETKALNEYFLAYNLSRNDGDSYYPNKEENTCWKMLNLDYYPCVNESSCTYNAQIICSYLREATGCTDPKTYLQPLEDFANASTGMTAELNKISDALENINLDNSVEYLIQINTSISTLKIYQKKLENTIFRPLSKICQNCTGSCPNIDINDSALSKAESKLNDIFSELGPLVQYSQIAETIYNNTKLRITENTNNSMKVYYRKIFAILKSYADDTKNKSSYVLSLVDNTTIRSKIATLNTLEAEINDSINAGKFDKLNVTFADYSNATASLNASMQNLIIIYSNVSNASKEIIVYMFFAESKTLNSDDAVKLDLLKQKKAFVDSQFRPGLTATQYIDIQAQYNILLLDAKVLASQPTTEQIVYLFGGISTKFATILDSIFFQIRRPTYDERIRFSSYLPIIISVPFFFLFLLVVLVPFFIYCIARKNKPIRRKIIVLFTLLVVILAGVISLGMFFSLDKSSKNLGYYDFMNAVMANNGAVIVIYQTNENASTFASMNSCAASISNALFNKTKISSVIYTIQASGCMMNGTLQPNCLDTNFKPMIMLNSSSASSASYSGFPIPRASVSGNKEYYDICPFAEAIKRF